MYSLNSNTRRITGFVQQEAYKWLFGKIVKNEYNPGADRQTQQLIIDIKKAGCITKASYEQFTQKIVYNPFTCIIQGKDLSDSKYITTNKIENFFIKYNGVVLPIGFIKEFFEDDYETQAEVDRYIATVVNGQEQRFILQCESALLNKTNQINELKLSRACIFNTAFSFHFTNVLKTILTFVTLWLCLHFVIGEEVVQKIIAFASEGEYEEWFSTFWFHVVLSIVVLFFLIFRIIKSIKTIVYYIRLSMVRGEVNGIEKAIQQFEDTKLKALSEYFKSVIPDLAREPHVISDAVCENVPSTKRQYFAIMESDFNEISERINKLLTSKHFAFLNAYYEEDTLYLNKKAWRKKIAWHVILCLVLSFMNVQGLRDIAFDTLRPALEYLEIVPEDYEEIDVSISFDNSKEDESSDSVSESSVAEEGTIYDYGEALGNDCDFIIGTNAATRSGVTYSTSGVVADDEKYFDINGKLNDKEFLISDEGQNIYVGFESDSDSYKEKGYHEISFKLNKSRKIIGGHVYIAIADENGRIDIPEAIEMLVSEDGENWTSLMAISPSGNESGEMEVIERVAFDLSGFDEAEKEYRYVQYRVVGEGLLLISEVEIIY